MLFELPKCQARGKTEDLVSSERKSDQKSHRKGPLHWIIRCLSFMNTAAFCNKLWWKVQKSKSGLSIGRHEIILEKMWKWLFPCLKITIVIENHSGSSESLTQTRGGETFWRWRRPLEMTSYSVWYCDTVWQCGTLWQLWCDNLITERGAAAGWWGRRRCLFPLSLLSQVSD